MSAPPGSTLPALWLPVNPARPAGNAQIRTAPRIPLASQDTTLLVSRRDVPNVLLGTLVRKLHRTQPSSVNRDITLLEDSASARFVHQGMSVRIQPQRPERSVLVGTTARVEGQRVSNALQGTRAQQNTTTSF